MLKLIHGNCFDHFKSFEDNFFDTIICDLPYGMTNCKWDTPLDLNLMWQELNRITKNKGAIILFGSNPFSSKLICSNINNFKHEWIYQKIAPSNFANAKHAPMRYHEHILVFGKNKQSVNYYPIKEPRAESGKARVKYILKNSEVREDHFIGKAIYSDTNFINIRDEFRYPSSIQTFNNRAKGDVGLHPTQKPVALLKYLVQTYSKEQDYILDFCVGSGTTAIACMDLNRNFVGIEKDKHYFEIAQERINNHATADRAC